MSWQDPDTMAETYYRTAYEHGEEAFARGESIEQCSEHYGPSEWWGMLGVEGWNNGWRDAFAASVDDGWWDDASYAAYQARD